MREKERKATSQRPALKSIGRVCRDRDVPSPLNSVRGVAADAGADPGIGAAVISLSKVAKGHCG